ncbi:phosphomannomutase/phosphoglucomutase, partial [Burkholderia sp. 9777_1386]|nr:phosphomannomutase/phosphoglucomutase [Burkholderia sp. 9777_1386]
MIHACRRNTGRNGWSGHVFFKDRWYGFDDGLYTGARLLEILAKTADP